LVGLCFDEDYQVEVWQCSWQKHAVRRGYWDVCKPSEARDGVPTPLRTQGHGQSHYASLAWVIRFVVAVRRQDICVDNCEREGRGVVISYSAMETPHVTGYGGQAFHKYLHTNKLAADWLPLGRSWFLSPQVDGFLFSHWVHTGSEAHEVVFRRVPEGAAAGMIIR
jgi:hypothetical protein